MLSMRYRRRSAESIDGMLLRHLAGLSSGSQRWFRTTLQAIVTAEPPEEISEAKAEPSERRPAAAAGGPALDRAAGGEGDVRREAPEHAELPEELKGIAEIADLLREGGRQHRQMGDDILRQELEEDEEEEPRDEDNGAG